jgi:hypothetical protein
MTKRLSKVLLLALLVFTAPVYAQFMPTAADMKKLSSVEVQWEDAPGAFMYEVEVFNSQGKKLKSFVAKSSLFKFKSTSGKIKIRGRVIDAYGKKGMWSPLFETVVPPEDLKFPETADTAKPIEVQANNKTMTGKVTLSWPAVTQARRYLIKVYDKDDKVIKETITNKLSEKFELPPGSFYFTITPIGNDKVEGKEVRAPRTIQVGSARLPMEKFEIIQNANTLLIKMPQTVDIQIFGELEYANHLAENWTPVLQYAPFSAEAWAPDAGLKPGRYRIGFWVTKTGWMDSEKFKHEFVIKPTEAYIMEPDPIPKK